MSSRSEHTVTIPPGEGAFAAAVTWWPESRWATAVWRRLRPLRSEYREQPKGCAVPHQNSPQDTFAAGHSVESMPGRAQTPMSCIDADVEAIRELPEWIERLWGNLAALSREDLSTRLDLLGTAADHRATDSRPVREALQAVLLSVGTGALAMLSEPTRQRLAAITGIELPGHLPSACRRAADGRGGS